MQNKFRIVSIFLITGILFAFSARVISQENKKDEKAGPVSLGKFNSSAGHWYHIYDKNNIIFAKPDQPKFKPSEFVNIADNILLYQKDNGGWPKNYDMQAILTPDQKDSLIKAKNILNTTFDNSTTFSQIEYLAKVYAITQTEQYKEACIKGFNYILQAQYNNGGWPQYYPLEDNYSRRITFNDGAFMGIMKILKDVTDEQPWYSFVDAPLRAKLKAAMYKGVDCILKCQIKEKGKLTAWCQQHDEKDLSPAWARKFEPPSICNLESAEIVLFLMDLPNPDKKIVKSIRSAVKWFEESKITGIKIKTIDAPEVQYQYNISKIDRVVEQDPSAPPIWTRYYELKTHRPMFCNRDSKVVYTLAEVDRERRSGYGWYTYAPQEVIDKYEKSRK
jgi:PelA/Pel-15E family pectate lyase